MIYDVLIIGAGPAGVTAAIYLKRAGLNVLVLYKDSGSLKYATIENFYSYDSVKGEDLFNKGLSQLKANNIDVVNEEALAVEGYNEFKITTTSREFYSKYLVIATGLNKGSIPKKYQSYLGSGVSTCAFCDGPFYKKKPVYVVGREPYLSQMKKELSYFTSDINELDDTSIDSLYGNDRIEGVLLKSGEKVNINNLFIALPLNSTALSNNIGVMVDSLIGEEDVVIKPLRDQFTNSPGIAGASILGDGSVSLIIDVSQLLELGVRQELLAQANEQLNN